MSEMTNQQYAEYVKRKSPASPIWGDLLRAFLIGGAICALGQVITELWVLIGLEEAEAGTACSMSLVFLGALFTGLGVKPEDLDGLVEAGMQQQRLLVNNMRPVTAEDARNIYLEVI